MARRARTLWRQLEEESDEDLLIECGMAWFAHRDEGWEAEAERTWRLSATAEWMANRLDFVSDFPELEWRTPQ
jgi:glycine/D-amino acid oxidase-like deaminating enzyme